MSTAAITGLARQIKKAVDNARVQHFSLGSTAISDVWLRPNIGLGKVNGVMWIKFRKVREYPKYRFDDVPMEVVAGMLNASSAGQYYHSVVKGKYPSTDINGPGESDAEIREYMFNLMLD